MGRTELWWLVAAGVVVALVTAVCAVRLLLQLVRARRLLKAPGIPLSTKAMFWGSIAYLVCPVDLLPDPIYLDDIGVLLLALRSVHAAVARAGEEPRGAAVWRGRGRGSERRPERRSQRRSQRRPGWRGL